MKWIVLVLSLFIGQTVEAKTFDLDTSHSQVGFKIRHLLTYVSGRFNDYSGKFEIDKKNGALIRAEATVQVASINTDNVKRDEHLRAPDFFDAKKFPIIKFVAEKFSLEKGKTGKVLGTLTMRGVSKPVTLDVDYFGEIKGPDGKMKAGASARAKIDRRDFGLTWSKTLETGGVLVGDQVTIELEIEGNEK